MKKYKGVLNDRVGRMEFLIAGKRESIRQLEVFVLRYEERYVNELE